MESHEFLRAQLEGDYIPGASLYKLVMDQRVQYSCGHIGPPLHQQPSLVFPIGSLRALPFGFISISSFDTL